MDGLEKERDEDKRGTESTENTENTARTERGTDLCEQGFVVACIAVLLGTLVYRGA